MGPASFSRGVSEVTSGSPALLASPCSREDPQSSFEVQPGLRPRLRLFGQGSWHLHGSQQRSPRPGQMCGIACDLWCDKGRSRGLSGYQVFVAPTSVVRVRECFLRCDLKCEVLVTQSCPSLCDPMNCRLLCAWNSPGQNTGVGSLSLLQGIFPTQGSNPGLPHCRWILYQLSHKGKLFQKSKAMVLFKKGKIYQSLCG